MFGIGPLELFALAAVALIVLGPRRLPEVARQVGRFMAEIRRTTYDLRATLDAELQSEDRDQRRDAAEARRQQFRKDREKAKAEGEWPPGGQQDAEGRPQPTVAADSVPTSDPGLEARTPDPPSPAGPAADPATDASSDQAAPASAPSFDPATPAAAPAPEQATPAAASAPDQTALPMPNEATAPAADAPQNPGPDGSSS